MADDDDRNGAIRRIFNVQVCKFLVVEARVVVIKLQVNCHAAQSIRYARVSFTLELYAQAVEKRLYIEFGNSSLLKRLYDVGLARHKVRFWAQLGLAFKITGESVVDGYFERLHAESVVK